MKPWKYHTAEKSQHGDMLCCSCHEKINSGDYRVYLNGKHDAYICQHRKCSNNDKNWEKEDKIREEKEKKIKEFEKDLKVFCEKWDFDLDDFKGRIE